MGRTPSLPGARPAAEYTAAIGVMIARDTHEREAVGGRWKKLLTREERLSCRARGRGGGSRGLGRHGRGGAGARRASLARVASTLGLDRDLPARGWNPGDRSVRRVRY